MKIFNLLVMAVATVASSELSIAAGEIFVGMMSATQSNMYNEESECYQAALDVGVDLNTLVDEQDTSLLQVL